MSRIGRLPVAIPAGVEVNVAAGNVVTVKGPKGTLERALPTEMEIKVEDGHVVVSRPNDLKKMKSLHRFNKKPYPQYGGWCQRRLHQRAGSKRCRL